MPLFIVKNNPRFCEPLLLSREDQHHLLNVLRIKKKETILVTDNNGHMAKILVVNTNPLALEVLKILDAPPSIPVTVFLPLIEKERIEWAIEKLCECHITGIQLITTERTQSRALSTARLARLEKIATAAQKQCHRCDPLIIRPAIRLTSFKPGTKHLNIAGVMDTDIATTNPHTLQTQLQDSTTGQVNIFVGPEGGFTNNETDFLKTHHCKLICLGQTILRTETAAILLAGLIKCALISATRPPVPACSL
ncbi:MAG: 16S rRNA (uracil(1498)-N(3))-methyltransferase [Deltaproteobacteria bacterium]|nr:16S rRNA (uracil(1498)-N(3))-methyltransferase [Deltaproteobacteria bacterium]